MKGFTNHFWNGVTTVYFAEIVHKIAIRNLYQVGLYHVFNPAILSKFEMLEVFNQVYSLDLTIESHEASVPIDRSLASVHELSGRIAAKPFHDQVQAMKVHFSSILR